MQELNFATLVFSVPSTKRVFKSIPKYCPLYLRAINTLLASRMSLKRPFKQAQCKVSVWCKCKTISGSRNTAVRNKVIPSPHPPSKVQLLLKWKELNYVPSRKKERN